MRMDSSKARIGRIAAIYQHPIKSMAGRRLDSGSIDSHGLAGDRRFAFRRTGEHGGFPWLTAGRFPKLVSYRPVSDGGGSGAPTHVVTPSGERLEIWSDALRTELASSFGSDVELMHLNHGMFDDGAVSIIAASTIAAIERDCGFEVDVRRFRPNLVVEADDGRPYCEDDWIGRVVAIGSNGPLIGITLRDVRCSMVSLHPDTAEPDRRVQQSVVRLNGNCAGVYGVVMRTGDVDVGDEVHLLDLHSSGENDNLRGDHA